MNKASSVVSGLILAGGRSSRMGGVDKGLQLFRNKALILWSLELLKPQVNTLMINANRSVKQYQQLGYPVLKDSLEGYLGPLAGMLSGLQHCTTEWLQVVPCDCPFFPENLVEQMLDKAHQQACKVVMAASYAMAESESESQAQQTSNTLLKSYQLQPVFCFIHRSMTSSLEGYLKSGQAKIEKWGLQENMATVEFPLDNHNASLFSNINTLAELEALQKI